MSIKYQKLLFVLSVCCVFFLGVVAAASGVLNIVSPEQTISTDNVQPGDFALVPPMLIPIDTEYREVADSLVITPEDARPVAYLASIPLGLNRTEVYFPEIVESIEGQISFQILSSLRYKISDSTVLVTLSKPSKAASETPMTLGNETVQLLNGVTAYVSANTDGEYKNQIVFVSGDLLVTVLGDLPVIELQSLAETVAIDNQ